MEPHTTNVPAEKKPINKERPLIHQGTAPPAAKKEFRFLPEPENEIPVIRTKTENNTIVIKSIVNILTIYEIVNIYLYSYFIKVFS